MNLYVGNLAHEATDTDVRELFEQFGTVIDANVVSDRETGRSRGFAFVTFDDDVAARQAIDALDGLEFLGRPLTVNEARPREPRSDRPPRDGGYDRPNYNDRPPRDGGYNRPNYNDRPPRDGGYDRPNYNDRPPRDGGYNRPNYNDRSPRDGGYNRPNYNDRPPRDGGYDRPNYNDRPPRDGGYDRPNYNDRPPRDGGYNRPNYNDRPPNRPNDGGGYNRPNYNDRPPRDGANPARGERTERKSFNPNFRQDTPPRAPSWGEERGGGKKPSDKGRKFHESNKPASRHKQQYLDDYDDGE
jgi:RNA recognition motif-containing protein